VKDISQSSVDTCLRCDDDYYKFVAEFHQLKYFESQAAFGEVSGKTNDLFDPWWPLVSFLHHPVLVMV